MCKSHDVKYKKYPHKTNRYAFLMSALCAHSVQLVTTQVVTLHVHTCMLTVIAMMLPLMMTAVNQVDTCDNP